MDKCVWKETIRENADEESMGPHDRCEGKVYTKEGEDVSIVKGEKRRDKKIHKRVAKKEIHSAIKITVNCTSILCREEKWKEGDGARLQVSE